MSLDSIDSIQIDTMTWHRIIHFCVNILPFYVYTNNTLWYVKQEIGIRMWVK